MRLNSTDPSCVIVAEDLASPFSGNTYYRAVNGNPTCTSAVIVATFTLGTWVESTNTTVYIVRHRSLTVTPSLWPSCGESASMLHTLGCNDPVVRQRVQFSATYELESDDPPDMPVRSARPLRSLESIPVPLLEAALGQAFQPSQ